MIMNSMHSMCDHKSILVLSDLHSNLNALREALIYAEFNDCFVIMLGDILDSEMYFEQSKEVIDLVYKWTSSGKMWVVVGNHDYKYIRYAIGNDDVQLSEMQKKTIDFIGGREGKYLDMFRYSFLGRFPYMAVARNLRCSHAAIYEGYNGSLPHRKVTKFMFGEHDKEKVTENGLPVRTYGWVDKLQSPDIINVVGHDIDGMGKDRQDILTIDCANDSTLTFLDCGSGKDIAGLMGGIELHLCDHSKNYKIDSYHKFGE